MYPFFLQLLILSELSHRGLGALGCVLEVCAAGGDSLSVSLSPGIPVSKRQLIGGGSGNCEFGLDGRCLRQFL